MPKSIDEKAVIAIDGKRLRRSHDGCLGKAAIHMVSAWTSANRLGLGHVKTDDKSNQIRAIAQLLQALVLKGCLLTIDAMGCQTNILCHIALNLLRHETSAKCGIKAKCLKAGWNED